MCNVDDIVLIKLEHLEFANNASIFVDEFIRFTVATLDNIVTGFLVTKMSLDELEVSNTGQ